MTNYIYYNGELYHASKKNHKYIAKIPIGKGKYRYFYTKEEYEAYKNKKSGKEDETKNSKTNSVSKFFKNVFNNMSKLFKKSKKRLTKTIENGKKFVEEVIFGINDGETSSGAGRNFKYIQRVKTSTGKYRYFYDEDEYERYMKSRDYLKNEPDFMKKVSKISEKDSFTALDNMKKVNPNYSRYDKGTSQNCANCTTAYELRCRGYDVEAAEHKNKAEYFMNGTDYRFDYYYKNAKSVTLNSSGNKHKSILNGSRWQKDFEYSANTVEAGILKYSGKNTRGDISVSWKSGGGHSMAYEVDRNGEIVIRDCQTNKTYKATDIADLVSNITITRTDNLELKKGVLNAVKR